MLQKNISRNRVKSSVYPVGKHLRKIVERIEDAEIILSIVKNGFVFDYCVSKMKMYGCERNKFIFIGEGLGESYGLLIFAKQNV